MKPLTFLSRRILLNLFVSATILLHIPFLSEAADPPGILNHQGRIAVNGVNFDGTGHFKFSLIKDAGLGTEAVLWHHDGTATGTAEPATAAQLTVTKGHYAFLLGAANPISPTVFGDNANVSLRIWFSTDGAAFEQLAPDRRIASAAYALSAGAASMIPDDSVTTDKIEDAAVTGAKLSADAVDGAKILDGSIALGDLSFVPGDITGVAVGTGLMGGGASGDVTLGIATGAITSSLLGDGSVTAAKLAPDAIGSTALAPGAITDAAILDGTITAAKLATATDWATANREPVANPAADIDDRFGWSVAPAGPGKFLVGATRDDPGANSTGSAYLFDTGGNLLLSLPNPSPNDNDEFGYSLAGNATVLAVGARYDDEAGASNAGAVYLFDHSGNLLKTLHPPTPNNSDHFGEAVAIIGDLLAVGCPLDDTGAGDAGAVYLFDFDGNLVRTLQKATPSASDRIGRSLATVGSNRLLVGDLANDQAHLFDIDTGNIVHTFSNPGGGTGDQFGASVAAVGTGRVLIGAPTDADPGAANAGSAHLFDLDGTLVRSYTEPGGAVDGNRFGDRVAATASGDLLVGGPEIDRSGSPSVGRVYLFDDAGNSLATLDNSIIGSYLRFSSGLAILSDGTIVVGAYGYSSSRGEVFLFSAGRYQPGLFSDGVRAGGVTSESLASQAVGTTHLGNGAVTGAKIANGAITLSRNGTDVSLSSGGGTISVDDADADPANELQAISLAGNTLSLSNTGGSVDLSGIAGAWTQTGDELSFAGNSVVATGTFGTGTVPVSGAGTRMMWIPGKAAFRAGKVDGDQWDDANVGGTSFAIGSNVMASGALSTAIGNNSIASGVGSFSVGSNQTASGQGATAFGAFNTASGNYSLVAGQSSEASGDLANAIGLFANAPSFLETAIGYNNTLYTPAEVDGWDETDRLFVIGNGNNGRSDALVMLKSGDTTLNGDLTVNGVLDATSITGSGASLTDVPAAAITGTIGTSLLADGAITFSKLEPTYRSGATGQAALGIDLVSTPGTATFTASYDQAFGSAPNLMLPDGWTISSANENGFTATSNWAFTPQTVDSMGDVGEHVSAALVDGCVAVAYFEGIGGGLGNLKYAIASDAYGNGPWKVVTVDDSGSVSSPFCSLAVVDGVPAVAYFDESERLRFACANGPRGTTNPWTIATVDDFGGGGVTESQVSLAVVDGKPAIVYTDFFASDVWFAVSSDVRGVPGSWTSSLVLDETYPVGFGATSLAVIDGIPSIACKQVNLATSIGSILLVRAANAQGGGPWTSHVVETSGDIYSGGAFTSLALVGGNPAITYHSAGALRYGHCASADGTGAWTAVTVETDGMEGDAGRYSSLATTGGRPIVSYRNDDDELRFAIASATDPTGTVEPWHTMTLDASPGRKTSLLGGPIPGIAYEASGSDDLRFLSFAPSWTARSGEAAPILAASAVTVERGGVDSEAIVDGSVTGKDLGAGSVGMDSIAVDSIDGSKIVDGSITAADLDFSPGDITEVIAGTGLEGGGTTGPVSLGIAAGGVGTAQVADGAVTGAKILDGTVTWNDIDAATLPANPFGLLTAVGENIAVGETALQNLTTGLRNTAVGENALQSLTTGKDNTAFGFEALASTTTAPYNTAIGEWALKNNVTGDRNTAVGWSALRSTTTGRFNTAVGQSTLLSSSGSWNTVIGFEALGSLISGDHNIAIGSQTGGSFFNSGDHNILIGASDDLSDQSNTIRIGDSNQTRAFVAGIHGVTPADAGTTEVVIIDENGQLGSDVITSGAWSESGDEISFTGNSVVATGTLGTGAVPVSGAGTRMMWVPGKAAFRAGTVDGTQWDEANIGDYSFAVGHWNAASGSSAVAMGNQNTASGNGAFTTGVLNTASGDQSVAVGFGNTAIGQASFVGGNNSQANGNFSIAFGFFASASGERSRALGSTVQAGGDDSTAIGFYTSAPSFLETAIGTRNTTYTPASTDAWDPSDRLFVIGNGDTGLSDALVMLKSGDTTLNGDLTVNGALDATSITGSGASLTDVPASAITGTIGTSLLADGAITSAKLAADSVTEAALMAGAVTSGKLGTDSVTELSIADDAVTIAKIRTSLSGTHSLTSSIANPDEANGKFFGTSVAGVGVDQFLVGANKSTGAVDPGAAYLFAADGTLLATLADPAPGLDIQFASSVAGVGADKLLVGAPVGFTGAERAGVVFVFDLAGNLLETIDNPAPESIDYFGSAVAGVGDDKLLVGAYLDDAGAQNSGSAYLLNLDGSLVATLDNPTPAVNDRFGRSIAAVGENHLFVGASGDDTGGSDAGSAYIFDLNGVLQATLNNPTPENSDNFGSSVAAVGNDKLLVGAPNDDTGDSNAGSAYLFDLSGNLLVTLNNPTPAADDHFGWSVSAVGDDALLVGANDDDTGESNAGSAYLFDLNGNLLATFNNPDPGSGDRFGASVAATANKHLVIGATGDDMGGISSGSAYIYTPDFYVPGLTSENVLDGAITSAKLAAGSVTAANLAANSVGMNSLAADSIDGSKIMDGSITEADLGFTPGGISEVIAGTGLEGGGTTETVTLGIVDGGIGATQMADGAITGAKLAADSVTASALADGAVTTNAIADATVTAAKFRPSYQSPDVGGSSFTWDLTSNPGTAEFSLAFDSPFSSVPDIGLPAGWTELNSTTSGFAANSPNAFTPKVASTAPGDHCSMAIVQGRLAIAYRDGGLKYAIAVDEAGNGPWTVITVDNSSTAGYFPSLAVINGSNFQGPAISYIDTGFGGNLKYARAGDNVGTIGGWSRYTVAPAGDNPLRARSTSLATVQGVPAIAYSHPEIGDLKYARANNPDGTLWTVTTVRNQHQSFYTHSGAALAVVDGMPCIAFKELGSNNQVLWARADSSTGSGTWTIETIQDNDFVFGTEGNVSTAIVNGNPAVSFYAEGSRQVRYARCDASTGLGTWTVLNVVVPNSDADKIPSPSLGVQNGLPVIAYRNMITDKIELAAASTTTGVGGTWTSGSFPESAPIATDHASVSMVIHNDIPAIAYTADVLSVIRPEEPDWTARGDEVLPIMAASVADGAISASQLANGAVMPNHLSADSVTANALAAGSVTTDAFTAGAVTGEALTMSAAWQDSPQQFNIDSFGVLGASDSVGSAMAPVGSDKIVVGAPGDKLGGATQAGAVYLIDRDGVNLLKINNPDPGTNGYFGSAVCGVGSGRFLVGDRVDNSSEGVAYLFDLDGNLLRTIANPAPTGSDSFAGSVAPLGNGGFAIGAEGADPAGVANSGVVYLYDRNGTFQLTVSNPSPASNDSFGGSLAPVGADHLLIGAIGDDTTDANSGQAYLFDLSGNLVQTFDNPTPQANENFGAGLAAIGSDKVLIGARNDNDDSGQTSAGAAYLFDIDGVLLQTFANPTPLENENFGQSIAAVGADRVLISDNNDDSDEDNGGAAYLFDLNGNLIRTLKRSPSGANRYFGRSIAVYGGGDRIAVGASGFNGEVWHFTAGDAYVPIRAESISGISSPGTKNLFFGGNAGNESLTGARNLGMGPDALAATTTGDDNTALGQSTLSANTTGSRNTAVGQQALLSNVDGSSNTALGQYALRTNTSGQKNTAAGQDALLSNTTGSENSAFGEDSLRSNTEGSSNTAVGQDALRSNTTASNNTAVGEQALYQATGSDNVAIGRQAGNSLTSGSHNITIANSGSAGESATIRIGDSDQTRAFIAGIRDVDPAGTSSEVVVIDENGQLGSEVFAGASNGSITTVKLADAAVTSTKILDGTITSLDIASGAINDVATTGTDNVSLGQNSLTQTAYPGRRNTAIGVSALELNTTGLNNTAVGYLALSSNDTGESNVAMGVSALDSNSEGDQNVAIGQSAMALNNSGNNNVAVGHVALYNNTIGNDNTAIGSEALWANTTGNFNTTLGQGTLEFNTNGSWNTAVGQLALQANTEGDFNVAIGRSAMISNTTGHRNTAIGVDALRSNTTGTENVAVGIDALKSNVEGSWNTALGREALTNNTSDLNTAIGRRALQANTNGSGNTALGNLALNGNTAGISNTAAGAGALRHIEGDHNIGLGQGAGSDIAAGSHNIMIGNVGSSADTGTIRLGNAANHTNKTFIHGIHGTNVGSASQVYINSNGQLGTVTSSRRFKEDIHNMADSNPSERLAQLRPVTFRYKEAAEEGGKPIQYGLIAEEVAEVFPDLAIYDEEGKPFTVKYHLLAPLLLNEVQQQQRELEAREKRIGDLETRLEKLEAAIGADESR